MKLILRHDQIPFLIKSGPSEEKMNIILHMKKKIIFLYSIKLHHRHGVSNYVIYYI